MASKITQKPLATKSRGLACSIKVWVTKGRPGSFYLENYNYGRDDGGS